MTRYTTEFQHSIDHPDTFWAEQARRIPWFTPPSTILEYDEQQHARWFVDGELNICHAALDHHVEQGRGEQPAIYWDSPVTHSKRTLTYREMRDQVATFAGALKGLGVEKGDRVVIYMPMVPEALMAMLACARLGAVHSVVFGGFAPHELSVRIDDAKPKAIIAASCGIEVERVIPYKPILDEAIALSEHQPDACVILQREQQTAVLGERDHDWAALMATAVPAECVPVKGSDPLYVLYTSGTTGKPKGVVRDHGRHAVALRWSMAPSTTLAPGEVFFWAASDVGWVVGHSYIVYAPLLPGAPRCLRGQAGGHSRPGRLLAGDRRPWGANSVHRAHRVPGHQEGGPRRQVHLGRYDLSGFEYAVPGRRAPGSGHLSLGRRPARPSGDRSLVADRDRLADRRQLQGLGPLKVKPGRPPRRCRGSG
jgi:propionyl-CoA synthetase